MFVQKPVKDIIYNFSISYLTFLGYKHSSFHEIQFDVWKICQNLANNTICHIITDSSILDTTYRNNPVTTIRNNPKMQNWDHNYML